MRDMHIDRVADIASPLMPASIAMEEIALMSQENAHTVDAGPLPLYRAMQESGRVVHDHAQARAAEKLQTLYQALHPYYQDNTQGAGFFARLGLFRQGAASAVLPPPVQPAIRGLYIYGGVGRGKSMLMDIFFSTSPVLRKRRVHFHAFMLEVHETLHRWRVADDVKAGDGGLLHKLAEHIAASAWLLCFDEFHVTNIADAMILGRLFSALFDLGVVVVATSNWAPGDLYQGGLQRERFLPFIGLLQKRMEVVALDGGQDYRFARLKAVGIYHTPLSPETAAQMASAFQRLSGGHAPAPTEIMMQQGRTLKVARQYGRVAWFDFDELCARALGAVDYLALAERYEVLLIDHIPVMAADLRNEARRFMTLIDILYEHRTAIVAAAAARPELLYVEGDGAFEFERTVSRLNEMQSSAYCSRPHLT